MGTIIFSLHIKHMYLQIFINEVNFFQTRINIFTNIKIVRSFTRSNFDL